MKSILFFDDFLVHREPNIERRFHSPEWIDEAGYADPASPYGMGYASVVPKPDGEGYYLYYVCATANREEISGEISTVFAMAESKDALEWTPMKTGRNPAGFPEHALFGGTPSPSGLWVFHNPRAGVVGQRYLTTNAPIMRAKIGIETIPLEILGSDNGLDWSPLPESEFLPHHSDTCNALLYNPIKKRFQITLRRRWGERRVFQVESEDLRRWTEPHAILHPSPIDPVSTHFYGMPTYYTSAGIFIGLLWTQYMPYNNIMGGSVTTEYTYSYDGEVWNRTHCQSMPLRETGTFGGGSIYGAAMIEKDNEILVYAVARVEEHHAIRMVMDAGATSAVLLPGKLRKNGFVSLRSTRGRGEITTECLRLTKPAITLNIKAPLGGVRAQLCDPAYRPIEGCTFADSREIRGDHLNVALGWRDESKFRELVANQKWLRLQIQLEHAEIFGINTEFEFTINDLAPVFVGL